MMLCRWAARLGVRVIGTVSTEAKARQARDSGCELPIVTADYRFAAQVLQATGGRGVDVVYDGLGGQASGTLDAVPLQMLSSKSITLSRPVLFHYTADRAALQAIAGNVFQALRDGAVRADIGARYPLAAARQVHEDLESRRTSGQLVLLP